MLHGPINITFTYHIILYDLQPNLDFFDRFSYKSPVSYFTDLGAVGVVLILAGCRTDRGQYIVKQIGWGLFFPLLK